MDKFKRIPLESVDTALDKADQYRLLNEPHHAESICLDVLEVDGTNQRAIVTLLLALTDQFPTKLYAAFQDAEKLLPQFDAEYDRKYYEGIVQERWASAQIDKGSESKGIMTWIGRAMKCYEDAESISGGKNPDPILRWNACARMQQHLESTRPMHAPLTRDVHSEYGDDVPPR